MTTLLCTVRRCGEPLTADHRSYRCPSGHSFDVARSGYVNLLQPQDSRSAVPGDSRTAVEARRRLADAGRLEPFASELVALVRELFPRGRLSILDVGCGEGTFLNRLCRETDSSGDGLDLSTTAVDMAARRYPDQRWIVGNADRGLPFEGASFDLVLSITARRPGSEVRRVLAPHGRFVVAVPAPDDLAELRREVLGVAAERDRSDVVHADVGAVFTLERRQRIAERALLDASAIEDLLASTYRGARASQRERVAGLGPLEVTQSRDVFVFAPA